MKVIEPQSALLSNAEVLAHINQLQAQPRRSDKKLENAETVRKEARVTNYLAPHRSSTVTTGAARSAVPNYETQGYSADAIETLMQRLKPYVYTPTKPEGLYKHEVLMMLNLQPTETSLLDCILEECDERFSEEQQQDILRIVGETLGGMERREDVNGGEDGSEVDIQVDRAR